MISGFQYNPRRGSRRVGGSTQAAARARRLALAPPPAAAPARRVTKRVSSKQALSPLFELLSYTKLKSNYLGPTNSVGTIQFDGKERDTLSDGYLLMFRDSISKTVDDRFTKDRLARQIPVRQPPSNVVKELIERVVSDMEPAEPVAVRLAIIENGLLVPPKKGPEVTEISFQNGLSFNLHLLKLVQANTNANAIFISEKKSTLAFFRDNRLTGLLISLRDSSTSNSKPIDEILRELRGAKQAKPAPVKRQWKPSSLMKQFDSMTSGKGYEKANNILDFFASRFVNDIAVDGQVWYFTSKAMLARDYLLPNAAKLWDRELNPPPGKPSKPILGKNIQLRVRELIQSANQYEPAHIDSVGKQVNEKYATGVSGSIDVIKIQADNSESNYQLFGIGDVKVVAKQIHFDQIGINRDFDDAPLLIFLHNGQPVGITTGLMPETSKGEPLVYEVSQSFRRNPRRGSRRVGGSTQAAARARRLALAPPSPPPPVEVESAPVKRSTRSKTSARTPRTKAAKAPKLGTVLDAVLRRPEARPTPTAISGALDLLLQSVPVKSDAWKRFHNVSGKSSIVLTSSVGNFISNGALLFYRDAISSATEKQLTTSSSAYFQVKELPEKSAAPFIREQVLSDYNDASPFVPIWIKAHFTDNRFADVELETGRVPVAINLKTRQLVNDAGTWLYVRDDAGNTFDLNLIAIAWKKLNFDNAQFATKSSSDRTGLLLFFRQGQLVGLLVPIQPGRQDNEDYVPLSEILAQLSGQLPIPEIKVVKRKGSPKSKLWNKFLRLWPGGAERYADDEFQLDKESKLWFVNKGGFVIANDGLYDLLKKKSLVAYHLKVEPLYKKAPIPSTVIDKFLEIINLATRKGASTLAGYEFAQKQIGTGKRKEIVPVIITFVYGDGASRENRTFSIPIIKEIFNLTEFDHISVVTDFRDEDGNPDQALQFEREGTGVVAVLRSMGPVAAKGADLTSPTVGGQNIKETAYRVPNPRRGSRRVGGSTQAAARARRLALAPPPPPPVEVESAPIKQSSRSKTSARTSRGKEAADPLAKVDLGGDSGTRLTKKLISALPGKARKFAAEQWYRGEFAQKGGRFSLVLRDFITDGYLIAFNKQFTAKAQTLFSESMRVPDSIKGIRTPFPLLGMDDMQMKVNQYLGYYWEASDLRIYNLPRQATENNLLVLNGIWNVEGTRGPVSAVFRIDELKLLASLIDLSKTDATLLITSRANFYSKGGEYAAWPTGRPLAMLFFRMQAKHDSSQGLAGALMGSAVGRVTRYHQDIETIDPQITNLEERARDRSLFTR